jgi:hypothetical protein
MLAFLLIWLAAVGLSFIMSLSIIYTQYRYFLTQITLVDAIAPPTFMEFLEIRMIEIARWIKETS